MVRALVLVLLALAACDDSGAPATGGCPYERPAETSAPRFDVGHDLGMNLGATVHVGSWRYLDEAPRASVSAALREGVVPEPFEVVAEAGACRRWLAPPDTSCGVEGCQDGAICIADDTCAELPSGAGAGPLDVRVGGVRLVLADYRLGLYNGGLPDTPTGCGTIRVSAPGADFPGFALIGAQVPALVPIGLEAVQPVKGRALTVRWKPADPSTRVRVRLFADEGAHGRFGWRSMLECDAPDWAGQVTFPVELLDPHLELNSCGFCPGSDITRYRRAVGKAGANDIELVASDQISF